MYRGSCTSENVNLLWLKISSHYYWSSLSPVCSFTALKISAHHFMWWHSWWNWCHPGQECFSQADTVSEAETLWCLKFVKMGSIDPTDTASMSFMLQCWPLLAPLLARLTSNFWQPGLQQDHVILKDEMIWEDNLLLTWTENDATERQMCNPWCCLHTYVYPQQNFNFWLHVKSFIIICFATLNHRTR